MVGDDGPALDTVLEGPLLSAEGREIEDDQSLVPAMLHKDAKNELKRVDGLISVALGIRYNRQNMRLQLKRWYHFCHKIYCE